MIYTRLAGGLGNQLFQLAATLALRGENGNVLLCPDGLLHYKAKRSFDLIRLMSLPEGYYVKTPKNRFLETLPLRLRIGRFLPWYGVNDRNFAQQLKFQRNGFSTRYRWLDGYFQHGWSKQLFDSVCLQMQNMLSNDLPSSRVKGHDCVIHIRGGDFLESQRHQVVDVEYYLTALKALRVSVPTLKSASIVTDDFEYAQHVMGYLKSAQRDINISIAPQPDLEIYAGWMHDFVLLRDAPSRIIGNSTFAWWATAFDLRCAPTVSPQQWIRNVPRDLYLSYEIVIAA